MEFYRAGKVERIEMAVGSRIRLESLRQAVTPPYLMLMPFIEAPATLVVEGQEPLDEDGVHGSVFQLHATDRGEGELVVGFRDLRTGEVTHRKVIPVQVTNPAPRRRVGRRRRAVDD